MERESWDDFFFRIAELLSTRSTCLHRQYGCVLVRDQTIVATGFNGSPRGSVHCIEVGCLRDNIKSGRRLEQCRAVHAEQNAIINAARLGVSTVGTELYIWPGDCPCPLCMRSIINAGISVIHYTKHEYPGWRLSLEILAACRGGPEARKHLIA